MMMHELGQPPRTYMESTIILSIASIIGFSVYYEMIAPTFLDYINSKAATVSGVYIQYITVIV